MGDHVFSCYASAAFGTEGLVAGELKAFHLRDVRAENGGVRFSADQAGLYAANIRSRFSDRIFVILAESPCTSFEDLFQLVGSIPWENYAAGTEKINISAKCSRSRLMSPRDCQSVSKKAVIERLKKSGIARFPETGVELPVLISVRSDHAKVLLNTSGAALSRRGYRTWNGEAPLRETLAAALVELSPWKPGLPLHDPCCGTGTILVEAAMHACGMAPCLNRSFAMDGFVWADRETLESVRQEIRNQVSLPPSLMISGSDIDPEALKLSEKHIHQAGLDGLVSVFPCPLQNLLCEGANGVFICNPPYGERMSDRESCRRLYRDLHSLLDRHPGWSLCAITSDPAFERSFGKRASAKRRLYNGRLECTFYIYG